MSSHLMRLKLLVATTIAFALAALLLFVLNAWTDAATGVFGAALGLLVPAVIDAAQVEKRRRTPGERAIEDDKP